MEDPKIVKDIFSNEDILSLKNLFKNYKNFDFQPGFSRYAISNSSMVEMNHFSNKLIDMARKTFNSDTLMPTYTLFVHYEGDNPPPSLYKHKDDNACTYTLDVCLYQTDTWDLWVDDKSYTLQENEALAYYGNDQMHWREAFPNPGKQHVAMMFFHFAEPDHWWFTKGESYLSVIRGHISEEQWNLSNSIN